MDNWLQYYSLVGSNRYQKWWLCRQLQSKNVKGRKRAWSVPATMLKAWNHNNTALPVRFNPSPPARVLRSMTKRWQDFRMNLSTAAAREDDDVDPSSLSYLYFLARISSSSRSSTRTIWLKIRTLWPFENNFGKSWWQRQTCQHVQITAQYNLKQVFATLPSQAKPFYLMTLLESLRRVYNYLKGLGCLVRPLRLSGY